MPKLETFFRKTGDAELPSTDGTTEDAKKITGKVIKVKDDEGWGFISSKDIKFTRIFFHWSSLRQDTLNFTELKKGMDVEFIPIQDPVKGWKALQIKVLESEADDKQPETVP